MRKTLFIILHNIRLLAADRMAFFWLLVMPVAFTFVMGIMFSGGGAGGERGPTRYALTVANLDEGARGKALLQAIEEAGDIDLLPVEEPEAGDEARRLVDEGDRSAALVIPADYSARLERGEHAILTFHQNPDRVNPLVTRQAVEKVVAKLNVEELAAIGAREAYAELRGKPSEQKAAELSERVRDFVSASWEPVPVTVAVEKLGRPTESAAPTMGYSRSSPAMALMFVLLNGLMMSSMLVDERRERTLARLLTAPVRRWEIIAANLGWRFAVGLAQFWFLVVLGALLFRVDWGDTVVGLLLVSVTYVAAVSGLSVLIGSWSRSSRQAESAALVASLSMCALGGLWWPLEITPKAYQIIGHLVPTGWAMDGMHNLVSRGYSLAQIAPQALVLLGFALVFSVAATATFRHE